MASTIPFDTHAFVKKLESVGFTEAQAEVQAEALAELVNSELATKRDLHEMELRLKHDLTLRMGAVTTAAVAIFAALVKLL